MTIATSAQTTLPPNQPGSQKQEASSNDTTCGGVSLDSVSKTFGHGTRAVAALKEVSLKIAPSDFVAVMGASGSGKSTLLNLISALTSPDSGRITIDSVDITTLKDPGLTRFRRERLGIIFQAYNLVPALSVVDNVMLPVLAGGRQGRQTVDEVLDQVGLTDRRDHRPDQLSGGEQQRVTIARALISDPSIILADEPTGNLDSVTGEQICELLRQLQQEHRRTIVVVTHAPDVAMSAGRVVVLKDGRKVSEFETAQFNNATELAAHYQDLLRSA